MHEVCKMCKKNKHRSCEEKKNIIKRLNVIEGQIRGIKQMVEDDRYCSEVIMQLSASMHSLKSLGNNILTSHMKSCMVDNIKNDNLEIIDINLYKLYEMDYNLVMEGTDELKKMLYLFVCDDNDLLVRLYEGDRFMKKVLKEANRLKVNIDDLLLYDKEEIKRDVYEAGVKRRNSIEIAIKLLKNQKYTFEEIADMTDLALYEVEKLKKQIDEGEI